ncbi:hypothetical protein LTR09_004254 [Extremus antarcticus]|uniref:Uncharacterized protein n=1 Tax=Extremus antarcticus TaxID=702011 RepID=A0AAJ0GAK4_9PEZI|nr:hypothetical protein LTR09_004254 [Extremus antarcticus]
MATQIPANSVWSAMTYVPPHGRCNHKTSLMSPACPCLRFMLHPVKAATSFECDGCNHHASFHSLENPAEDAVLRKWEAEEAETKNQSKGRQAIRGAPAKKRRRVEGKAELEVEDGPRVLEILDDEMERVDGMFGRTMALFGGGVKDGAGMVVESVEPVRATRVRRKKGVD